MLCCMPPGFLLFTVMLIPLSQVLSPLCATIAIFTVINPTRVSSLGIFSWVGAWCIRSASSIGIHTSRKTPSHILSFFRITTKTRLCLKEPFENLAALFRQNKYVRIVFAMEACEGPNAEDKGDRLMTAFGHHLEDMIPAINLVLLAVIMTVGNANTSWHPQFFSAVTFESQRLTEGGATVDPRCSNW